MTVVSVSRRRPRVLSPGDTVAVWAPSSSAPRRFSRRFSRGVDALRGAGFDVVVGQSCASAQGPSTLPPTDLAAELHTFLDDSRIGGVIAAVGGWTTLAVLPHIDLERVAAAGKPIVGYSDLTSLLNYVAFGGGLVTYYGPMVLSEWGEAGGPWEFTRKAFLSMVAGGTREFALPFADAWSDELLWWERDDTRSRKPTVGGERPRVLRAGSADGALWGGSVIALGLLLGTPMWMPPAEPSVMVLEAEALSPDEWYVRLEQLRLAGAFDRAVAVAVSKIGRPRETPSGYADFDEVTMTVVPKGVPVVAGLDAGHTEPMVTLPIGGRARMDAAVGAVPAVSLLA